MDQHTINWIMFAFGSLASFLLHQVWNAVRELQQEDRIMAEKLSSIQILVAGDYVKKAEFDSMALRIFEKLENIEKTMNKKADRPNP